MMPEIFENTSKDIVGVIVALSTGRYAASIRINLRDYSEGSPILQRIFDQLEEARHWIRTNALKGTLEAA
jgi:hypothetical protein